MLTHSTMIANTSVAYHGFLFFQSLPWPCFCLILMVTEECVVDHKFKNKRKKNVLLGSGCMCDTIARNNSLYTLKFTSQVFCCGQVHWLAEQFISIYQPSKAFLIWSKLQPVFYCVQLENCSQRSQTQDCCKLSQNSVRT